MFYKASDLSQATYAAKSALYFWHNRCVLPLAGLAVLDGAASPVFLKRKELLFPLALSSANPQDPAMIWVLVNGLFPDGGVLSRNHLFQAEILGIHFGSQ